MAFIPVPDVVQCRLNFQDNTGTVAQNVLYVKTSSVPTLADMEDIGGLFHTWALDALMPSVTANWTILGIIMRSMSEEEGIETNYVTGFPIVGSAAGDAAPNNVSYTVTWSTGLVGRSARGRSYGLGVANADVANGKTLTDGARAFFQAKWEALRIGLESGGHALQVVSFVDAGVPRTVGRALPVLATNVRFPVATQRRRLA